MQNEHGHHFFPLQMCSFIVSWINEDRIACDTCHLQASRCIFFHTCWNLGQRLLMLQPSTWSANERQNLTLVPSMHPSPSLGPFLYFFSPFSDTRLTDLLDKFRQWQLVRTLRQGRIAQKNVWRSTSPKGMQIQDLSTLKVTGHTKLKIQRIHIMAGKW